MEENKKKEYQDNPHLKEAREHFRSARRNMYKHWEKLLPEGFLETRRAARKEMLLGLRNLLDFAIEKTEKHSQEQ